MVRSTQRENVRFLFLPSHYRHPENACATATLAEHHASAQIDQFCAQCKSTFSPNCCRTFARSNASTQRDTPLHRDGWVIFLLSQSRGVGIVIAGTKGNLWLAKTHTVCVSPGSANRLPKPRSLSSAGNEQEESQDGTHKLEAKCAESPLASAGLG